MLTQFQAKYFSYELTRQRPSGDLGKLSASLQNAQVDMNPHQVEAALFAFKSPLSRGAILADEVGLGKTIEAGIILSQKKAENKKKLLVICPANLRKQWNQELSDKFFLPSIILEKKSFDQIIKSGNLNPFNNQEGIIICSYQFIKSKEPYVSQVNWDLVIIDEAHRLRNVYKPGNKIANTIKNAVYHSPKVLLTATPLQNSLLELYGLVSIIDEYSFGDIKSYKSQYARLGDEGIFEELKNRLAPICTRTLRRQVLEYISYTNRIPIVEEFYPFDDELELYDLVSAYLQKPALYALPSSQRHLMTLILRKLLSSSTYAISGTFLVLKKRLVELLEKQQNLITVEEVEEEFNNNYDDYEDLREEWEEEVEDDAGADIEYEEDAPLTPQEIEEVKAEIEELEYFHQLALGIQKNSKGERLVVALKKGFEKLEDLGANPKAMIFTESTRTQLYIQNILEAEGYDKSKIVLFNGTNADAQSKAIYEQWKIRHANTDKITGSATADKRQAIVDYFRDGATIMIATEAAAEGINLQFCSLVVNYDLPWNPQRIEQRIGRCHRYGQKFDVVVVNFLNKSNAADRRVYELLDEKFKLFDGVFGASDQVLGAVGSGVDFEMRIAQIYQECRTEDEIKQAFDQLQLELEPQMEENILLTKRKLLENFDEEVHERLRVNLSEGKDFLNKYEKMLWALTEFSLNEYATFSETSTTFQLLNNPFPTENIHIGKYRMLQSDNEQKKSEIELPDDVNIYRVGHPLAQSILQNAKHISTDIGAFEIDLSGAEKKITLLDKFIGECGWLKVSVLSISSFELEEYILVSCVTDNGEEMPGDLAIKMLSLNHSIISLPTISTDITEKLNQQLEKEQFDCLDISRNRNNEYYNEEIDKLEKWADDMKLSLEKEIKDLESEIKLKRGESRRIVDLNIKVRILREIKDLEKKRNDKRRNLFEAQDQIDFRKENLLNEIESRLQQSIELSDLFTIKWNLK
jgi:superfamily II DNA or RNA helicase